MGADKCLVFSRFSYTKYDHNEVVIVAKVSVVTRQSKQLLLVHFLVAPLRMHRLVVLVQNTKPGRITLAASAVIYTLPIHQRGTECRGIR